MAAIGNSCYWLADFLKNLLLWNCLVKWTETCFITFPLKNINFSLVFWDRYGNEQVKEYLNSMGEKGITPGTVLTVCISTQKILMFVD